MVGDIISFLSEPFNPKYSLGETKGFGNGYKKSLEKQSKKENVEENETKKKSSPKINRATPTCTLEELQKHINKVQQKEIRHIEKKLNKPTEKQVKKTKTAVAKAKRQKYKQMRAYQNYLKPTESQENLVDMVKRKRERTIKMEAPKKKKKVIDPTPAVLNFEDLVSNGLDRYRANPFVSFDHGEFDNSNCLFWVADLDQKDTFNRKYKVQEMIGEGTYGRVYRVTRKNEEYVAKVLSKNDMNVMGVNEFIEREVAINQQFCSSNLATQHVTKFIEALETETSYYLIFEYIVGNSLMMRKNVPIGPEKVVRSYFVQLLEALKYIHQCGVFHGDLQLANVLLQEDSKSVKLIDFGCANYINLQKKHSHFTGNLYFAAPELLSGSAYAGPEIDIWSAGVCLYKMLTGYLPFDRAADAVKLRFSEPLDDDDELSDSAKDLFKKIFVVNGDERPTAEKLLSHPWCLES